MSRFLPVFVAIALSLYWLHGVKPDYGVMLGELLYASALDTPESVRDWTMEGPGKVTFTDGWMTMHSPGEEMHHVFWCPKPFPESFLAQWEMQNLHPEAGLCIVFFAATGLGGEDVLDPGLPERDGTFSQYNNGALKNYHISYYSNTPTAPDRPVSRLRKNPGKNIVFEGPRGILADSEAIHKVTLIKDRAHVRLFVDDRKIIDWEDDGKIHGETYGAGKIALRQMKWTQFRYRNLKVWAIE